VGSIPNVLICSAGILPASYIQGSKMLPLPLFLKNWHAPIMCSFTLKRYKLSCIFNTQKLSLEAKRKFPQFSTKAKSQSTNKPLIISLNASLNQIDKYLILSNVNQSQIIFVKTRKLYQIYKLRTTKNQRYFKL